MGAYLPDSDIDVTSTITDITAPIVAGLPYSFTVEVSNNGPAMAEGLTVHDLIQGIPGVQVTNILTAPNWFCSGDLTCTRQNPMTVTTETVATVTVIIPANTPAGAYSHLLAATADNPDANLANNVASYPFTVTAVAALGVEKTALVSEAVAGGAPVGFKLVISNTGPSDAYNVVVTDTLPANMTLLSMGSSNAVMSCSLATGVCTIPVIAAGEQAVIDLVAKAASNAVAGPATNSADAVCRSAAPLYTCTGATGAAAVTIIQSADLAVDKTGPLTVTVADAFSYTVTVYNNGPSDATGVVVTDTLPPGVSFGSASGATCAATGGVVTCSLPTLAANTTATIIFNVTSDVAFCFEGKVNNYVKVSAATADPDLANNDDDWGTIIFNQADLSITKTASSPVIAGETATFTLTVNNAGPGCATNVRRHGRA